VSTEANPLKLLDQKAVADLYGVHSYTIGRWERQGKIPRAHVDQKNFKRWLYRDIAAHIEGMGKAQLAEAAR
jgi:predicted site-specific integrase-resolvase